jgi:hypothetical protein
MTRRKREIVGLTNEQDFPHLVELAVPPGGFRGAFPRARPSVRRGPQRRFDPAVQSAATRDASTAGPMWHVHSRQAWVVAHA